MSYFFIQIRGQVVIKKFKTVQLIKERDIYLNGGTRATFGGKSRTYIQVDLPINTVRWYYSFSTSTGESGTGALNLATQLATKFAMNSNPIGELISTTGVADEIAESIKIPQGSSAVDIYLCDRENIDLFLEKQDNFGGSYTYKIGGSVENVKQAIVDIKKIKTGTWYLGLKNPSQLDGVNISIEVVAIIEYSEINMQEWSQERKESISSHIYNQIKNNLPNMKEELVRDISICYSSKWTNDYTPLTYNNLTNEERDRIHKSIIENCLTKINGGEKTENKKQGVSAGDMGWEAFRNGDIEKAILFSKKAIELDSTLGLFHGNLGLFHLIKGDEITAFEYYLDAIKYLGQDKINKENYLNFLIKNYDIAKLNYPKMINSPEIRQQLEIELKKN